jgi:transcriptional regulatory protein LevR
VAEQHLYNKRNGVCVLVVLHGYRIASSRGFSFFPFLNA